MEQTLSRPPHATFLPVGEKAQVITHDERSGIACTLLVDCAFQTISLPSCEAETSCLPTSPSLSHQCIA